MTAGVHLAFAPDGTTSPSPDSLPLHGESQDIAAGRMAATACQPGQSAQFTSTRPEPALPEFLDHRYDSAPHGPLPLAVGSTLWRCGLNWLFDMVRRACVAALVIALLACAVEVALRWHQFQEAGERRSAEVGAPIPIAPSRATGLELPSAWFGTARHAETGAPLPLRVNSLGLRGPEYPRLKPAGVLRILCLGDETTLAAGHSEEETYPGQLASLLRGTFPVELEVINAGLPGGCPLTESIQFRRLLTTLVPDIVVLHVDVSDALEDSAARSHLRMDDAGEAVAVVHPSLEVDSGPLSDVAGQFALAKWLEGRLSERVAGTPSVSTRDLFQRQLMAWRDQTASQEGPPRVLQPLAQLKLMLEARGATLVVTTCPNAWQAAELLRSSHAHGGENDLLNAPAAAVRRACEAWGVASVDATSAILRHPEPARLYLRDGSHMTNAGYTVYATEIARELTSGSSFRPLLSPVADRGTPGRESTGNETAPEVEPHAPPPYTPPGTSLSAEPASSLWR